MSRRIIIGSAALASLLSLALHVALNSPISPLPRALPPSSSFQPNNLLKGVEKLGEGILKLPEDVCVGNDGKLYTATRDGWIKRMHANGTWEDWKLIGGISILGLTRSKDGGLIVCDTDQVYAFDAGYSWRINIEFSRPKAEKHSRPEAGNQRASAARFAGRRMLV